MSPPSLTAAPWSYNTGPHWVTCQLFQTYPQQLTTVWILNGSSSLFSFYTWRPPVCLLSNSLQYMVTWRSLCVLATPCSQRSRRHKEEVRVYLFYSSLRPPALLLMLLITLLYMFTYTPLKIIMFTAHVVKPEVRKQHSLNKMRQMFGQDTTCILSIVLRVTLLLWPFIHFFLCPLSSVHHYCSNGVNPFICNVRCWIAAA